MMRRFKIIGTIATFMLVFISAAFAQSSALDKYLFEGMLKLASQGDREAEYHVGMLLNNGIGVAADRKAAFQWFKKSAEAGDPLGAFKLGCYYDGQFPGVIPTDHALGLKYKLIAAEQGYDLAQLGVAQHYHASKNFPEAVRWWTAAAKQGETDSMHYLSEAYAQGQIVQTDLTLSYRYLDALKRLPEFSSDQWVADALAFVTKKMSAGETAAAKSAAAFIIEPTALTLKARDGVTEAKNYLAANMR